MVYYHWKRISMGEPKGGWPPVIYKEKEATQEKAS